MADMFGGEDDPFASVGAGEPVFQTGGAPPRQQSGQLPQFQGKKEPVKYNIVNMFWLVNPKIYTKEELLPNEVHFVTISFNIGFGNLRIEVCNMSNESVKDQLICLNKIQRITNGTIYPTAMFQLVCKLPDVVCYEQIINYDGSDWQSKINPVRFVTNEKGSYVMSIGQHVYEFSGWQKEVLLYCCKFGLKEGMILTGENTLKN